MARSLGETIEDDLDAADWVRRWDLQQACYVPDREAIFSHILDIIERLDATPGRLLDLGCGPGSLAHRALNRWPDAEIVGLDLDPVLLELARRTLGDRIRWVETDLRSPDWQRPLGDGAFDAMTSATALHWLDPAHLEHLTTGLAEGLRPGGVFINYDTLPADPANPRLAALTAQLRHEQQLAGLEDTDAEDWSTWWTGLAAHPQLDELFAERNRRLDPSALAFDCKRARADRGTHATITEFAQALRHAGFAEVDTLVQLNDRRLLIAIR